MKLKINVLDAFTQTLFEGNTAAVIITDQWLNKDLMQSIAAQNNISETAFLCAHASDSYKIRWFSPLTEVAFCGHATLASAYVIFAKEKSVKKIDIHATSVGKMSVRLAEDDAIVMNFPNRKPGPVGHIPAELLAGLSIKPIEVYKSSQAYFAIYANDSDVRELQADSSELKKLAPYDVVASAVAKDVDFVSRYFWPANGGDEDPVTGSIHAGLAPFWAEKLGRTKLLAHQVSQRGGVIGCNVLGDRVEISGHVVPYLEGWIEIADD